MTTTLGGTPWHSQMVLSNGNLTATANAGFSVAGLAVAAISGKVYYEFILNVTDGNGQCGFGVGNASINQNGYLGSDVNGYGYWPGPGQVYTNGGVTNTLATGTTNGTVVCIAVDATARLIWFRINNGNWNNAGTANPATGTGGISISSVTGTLYPAISLTVNAEQATARFASSSWGYSAPSGFVEINSASPFVTIFLTTAGAGTWVAPSDFNPANNSIEAIGGGRCWCKSL